MRTLFAALFMLGTAAGVPTGYTAVPDKATADMSKLAYVAAGSNWDVKSGPVAHILFAAKDSASGIYAAQTTIRELSKPAHREAFGLFIGGKDLSDPTQRTYTYFVVAGTGQYLVKVMKGTQTTTISDWQDSPGIPKLGASGTATYALKVHVAANEIHFYVNGQLIATVPKAGTTTDGIAGLRINHNLHLMITPLTVMK